MAVKAKKRFWAVVRDSLWVGWCAVLFTLPAGARNPQTPVRSEPQGHLGGLAGPQQPDRQPPGTIRGKVVDQSGALIGGAQVKLTRDDPSPSQEVLTDDDGQFSFANLAPGPFHLTIASRDLTPQTFDDTLHPGEAYTLPLVMLTIATQMTEVRVGVRPEELAEEQVQEEEKQRVFGIIPNFFVSYDPHAVPLPPKLKFRLAWKSSTDPFTFLAIGVVAAAEQAGNQWRGYGQGAHGYAQRYAASYADVFAGTLIGGAVLPTLLKQDPRYFYKGTGNKGSRILHALGSAVICKGDNGRLQPNYSNIGGAFAAGGLANLYYPASNRNGASVAVSTALIRIGESAVANVFQEFLVAKLTPSLHNRAAAQP